MNAVISHAAIGQSHPPVWEWMDVAAFGASADLWGAGQHSIGIDENLALELLVAGSPFAAKGSVIPVFFGDAAKPGTGRAKPHFEGKFAEAAGIASYLAIADPTLRLGADLSVGWYAGTASHDVQGAVLALLTAVAERSGKELLLVGGSSGGFAALRFGHLLGDAASVLVWNPQTDIAEYNPNFVRTYAEIAFPDITSKQLQGPTWKDELRKASSRTGLGISLHGMAGKPRRLVYLQNSDDWHVPVHAVPYTESRGYVDEGQGLFGLDSQRKIWFYSFDSGHQPPPLSAILHTLSDLLDRDATASAVIQSLKKTALLKESGDPAHARPLSGMGAHIRGQLTVLAEASEGTVTVTVDTGLIPPGYGGLRYGIFQGEGPKQRTLAWYSRDTAHVVSAEAIDMEEPLDVFVRDGFNRHVCRLSAMPPKPQTDSARTRVFIYGSCVSRDSFSLENPFELAGYVARSPLGSAFASAGEVTGLATEQITSQFQRRMVDIDVQKKLGGILESTAFDILLIDFIDERFPLLKTGRTVISYSNELRATGLVANAGELVQPGSDEAFALWESGLDRLLAYVPAEKIVVNRVYWAERSADGEELPNQEYIRKNNKALDAFYEHLKGVAGIRQIEFPADIMVADPHHQWGAAPYHHVEALQRHMLAEIARITA